MALLGGAGFERKDSKGKFMINIKAVNGQVVGTSERCDPEKSCENGIGSVGKSAPGAKIEDLTA
ncbi:MAG: YegP family protein [Gammaproteobacteria bacterium]|nr:YegP family protein [Gammaproteobacteria bacterium]